jgi:hypothetical protein
MSSGGTSAILFPENIVLGDTNQFIYPVTHSVSRCLMSDWQRQHLVTVGQLQWRLGFHTYIMGARFYHNWQRWVVRLGPCNLCQLPPPIYSLLSREDKNIGLKTSLQGV